MHGFLFQWDLKQLARAKGWNPFFASLPFIFRRLLLFGAIRCKALDTVHISFSNARIVEVLEAWDTKNMGATQKTVAIHAFFGLEAYPAFEGFLLKLFPFGFIVEI